MQPDDLVLYVANNTAIKTFGNKQLAIDLSLRKDFNWYFIIAVVKTAIIGADFLTHYGLQIDLRVKSLIDTQTTLQSKGLLKEVAHENVSTINSSIKFHDVIAKYVDITNLNRYQLQTTDNVQHRIITNCQPISERPRCFSGEKLKAIKDEFRVLLHHGIVRPSSSPWASPIHLVKKMRHSRKTTQQ
ncbi:uncharacterized protein LOC119677071 [Teleopsis dalmanni]|uniref:uncharacterized protein LOC119677071 n=1 Tax=Teleopsis dalmanni TaxID=139649 RepID=UPI0018CCE20D|nr:uncharacterized protein LOC119677071 [Teleopsis dalmanni]